MLDLSRHPRSLDPAPTLGIAPARALRALRERPSRAVEGTSELPWATGESPRCSDPFVIGLTRQEPGIMPLREHGVAAWRPRGPASASYSSTIKTHSCGTTRVPVNNRVIAAVDGRVAELRADDLGKTLTPQAFKKISAGAGAGAKGPACTTGPAVGPPPPRTQPKSWRRHAWLRPSARPAEATPVRIRPLRAGTPVAYPVGVPPGQIGAQPGGWLGSAWLSPAPESPGRGPWPGSGPRRSVGL